MLLVPFHVAQTLHVYPLTTLLCVDAYLRITMPLYSPLHLFTCILQSSTPATMTTAAGYLTRPTLSGDTSIINTM